MFVHTYILVCIFVCSYICMYVNVNDYYIECAYRQTDIANMYIANTHNEISRYTYTYMYICIYEPFAQCSACK